MKYLWLLDVFIFACGRPTDSVRSSQMLPMLPSENQVVPVKLFEVPSFCEGVTFDRSGNGYVSFGDQVERFDLSGNHEHWADVGSSNGHKVLADGTHLVCSRTDHGIVHLDGQGNRLGLYTQNNQGADLRVPNDLCLDDWGGVYFSDARGFNGNNELGTIHYVDSAGQTFLLDDNLPIPNGIAASVDGSRLIVALTGTNEIIEYQITGPGLLGPQKLLAKLPPAGPGQPGVLPDGICLDSAGNIYVAHYGTGKIRVLSPQGELLRSYDAGNLIVSNVAFGGPERNQLFVTGAISDRNGVGAVYRLDLPGVRGLDLLRE